MKKKCILILLLTVLFFSGCNHIQEIENNKIITACMVTHSAEETKYRFLVSVPEGGESSGESGSKPSGKVYEFVADNFYEAIKQFENSGQQKTDITHMSLFAGDINYFNSHFAYDEKHIRKCILSTPLIYTCVISGETDRFVECINTEYSSKADDFSKNVFDSPGTLVSCSISELSLAVNNPYYTLAIPVVSIENYGETLLPIINNAAIYSANRGAYEMTNDEYGVYGKWRKKYKPESKGYKIYTDTKNMTVNLDNKKLVDIARKYAIMDIDILNTRFYVKKNFTSYKAYEKFINGFDFINVHFAEVDK